MGLEIVVEIGQYPVNSFPDLQDLIPPPEKVGFRIIVAVPAADAVKADVRKVRGNGQIAGKFGGADGAMGNMIFG